MRRPTALLFQPHLDGAGGGPAVAAFLLQVLAEECDVTMLSMKRPDLREVNRRFGTSFDDGTFARIKTLPIANAFIEHAPFARLAHFERSLLLRRARAIAAPFDVVVSGANEIDVGRRAIQYVHFPAGYYPRPDDDRRWYHGAPGGLALYYAVASRIATMDPVFVSRNRTLVNSAWTGDHYAKIYDGPWEVLYPPIGAANGSVPWEARRAGFIMLGRISPEKRVLEVLEILERVRAAGFDLELELIGTYDRHSPGIDYARRVFAALETRPWVRLRLDLSRAEVFEAIGSTQYAIHGMHDEHFGMSIAEVARAGCIVFVHDSGGQVEIVRDPGLRYAGLDEAAAKILAVLRNPSRVGALRERLQKDAAEFDVAAFVARFRTILNEELARR
jgi:glycosyltransferase involved in cell wall biosynthesis